mmetsp:Transcript_34852/g.43019  ORF Transcript_34852/g.43019 Transcript_34852/m.43019 type:complete len:250 (-) Transcript_34852:1612-2361(-)
MLSSKSSSALLRNAFNLRWSGYRVLPAASQPQLAFPQVTRIPPPLSCINNCNYISGARSFSDTTSAKDRRYHWIEPEAEMLIARAYARHQALADSGKSFPPSLSIKDLEAVGKPFHYEPKTTGDKVAKKLTNAGEKLMSLFFRTKYDHHAVTLETIAAVPGIVGAAHRHLRSLRSMKRDHGWINPLQEEAENERMHLLIWMQHTKPSRIERAFVVFAQGLYVAAYSVLMFVSPKTAHRTVGYLEEAVSV